MKVVRKFRVSTVVERIVCAAAVLMVAFPQRCLAQLGEPETQRFGEVAELLLGMLEGTFGALIMIVAGLVAIISAAMGAYRAAMSCLIVAIGAFILRTFVEVFFGQFS